MKYFILICLPVLLCPEICNSGNFRVVFYNCENFFDCADDSLKNDEEYLPGGLRGWNYTRYEKKQRHVARVLVSIGEWEPPALVGLCEIENDRVLKDLTRYSVMKNLNYRYIHYESDDKRGVDVALLYQPDKFKAISSKPLKIIYPGFSSGSTRDILYVKGLAGFQDSLHVFVCHFPSRLGGEAESDSKRQFVAGILRKEIDSIRSRCPEPKIIIMGDFNDYPDNVSMQQILGAVSPEKAVHDSLLINLMFPLHLQDKGSHKHSGHWGCLDQIIVSRALNDTKGLRMSRTEAYIFDAAFLLEDDKKFLGKQAFRTYAGFQYTGGYSDHLPVYTCLIFDD